MSATQQPEALHLAHTLSGGKLIDDSTEWADTLHAAAAELRRQHARIAELEDVAGMAIKRIAELEAQLSAIGAGGVPVPEGWALVPLEATLEMIEAWGNATELPEGTADRSDDEVNAYAAQRDWRAMLAVAPAVVAVPEAIEQTAVERYKVVPSHESVFHRWAVVAGNGTQQLYIGREVECLNMARKFTGAFLDGAFLAMQNTAPAHPAEGVPAQAVELEVDDLIDRLLNAQQDLNLAANVHMDQSIASASTLLDEVEIALRTLAATIRARQ